MDARYKELLANLITSTSGDKVIVDQTKFRVFLYNVNELITTVKAEAGDVLELVQSYNSTTDEIEKLRSECGALANLLKVAEKQTEQLTLIALGEQCLAEIKAEAGRAGYLACLQYVGGVRGSFDEDLADQYADKIRKGEL